MVQSKLHQRDLDLDMLCLWSWVTDWRTHPAAIVYCNVILHDESASATNHVTFRVVGNKVCATAIWTLIIHGVMLRGVRKISGCTACIYSLNRFEKSRAEMLNRNVPHNVSKIAAFAL